MEACDCKFADWVGANALLGNESPLISVPLPAEELGCAATEGDGNPLTALFITGIAADCIPVTDPEGAGGEDCVVYGGATGSA